MQSCGSGGASIGGGTLAGKTFKNSLKLASFKDLINKLSYAPIHVQTYYLLYGNGGEGYQEGWNWFYKQK